MYARISGLPRVNQTAPQAGRRRGAGRPAGRAAAGRLAGQMASVKWSNEEWRRLQTSLFSVTGTTRIRLSELTAEQWAQVVKETRRSREDIDAALDAMLRRQELPGGRVPVQTTERLFRESVPLLRGVLDGASDDAGAVPSSRLERMLLAIESFNFATLPYDDLFVVWNHVGKSEGLMEHHESLRCVYSVLGQVGHACAVSAWRVPCAGRDRYLCHRALLTCPPARADNQHTSTAHGRSSPEKASSCSCPAPADQPSIAAAWHQTGNAPAHPGVGAGRRGQGPRRRMCSCSDQRRAAFGCRRAAGPA